MGTQGSGQGARGLAEWEHLARSGGLRSSLFKRENLSTCPHSQLEIGTKLESRSQIQSFTEHLLGARLPAGQWKFQKDKTEINEQNK